MTVNMEDLGGDDAAIRDLYDDANGLEASASRPGQGVLLGTILAINLEGTQAGALGRPLLARLSQKGYQVHWSTLRVARIRSASDLLGPDHIGPDLIVIETHRAETMLSPEYQRALAALGINVIPTVVLTHVQSFPLSVAAIQSMGVVHIWSGPVADDLAALEQFETYVKLGQRTQLLLQQKQELITSIQQRDRALKQHYMIELVMSQKQQVLENLAYLDGLTQIPNRRYLDATLAQEWQRALREGTPLAFMICDVDYFKRYNDTYGHPKGDHCLKKIATVLAATIKRPGDFVGRYGGEEFAIVLPNTDRGGAQRVGASIQANVKALHLAHRTSDVKPYITLSLGITSVVPERHLPIEHLTTLADKALYEAKLLGRDQIAVYPPVDANCDSRAESTDIPAVEVSLKSFSA